MTFVSNPIKRSFPHKLNKFIQFHNIHCYYAQRLFLSESSLWQHFKAFLLMSEQFQRYSCVRIKFTIYKPSTKLGIRSFVRFQLQIKHERSQHSHSQQTNPGVSRDATSMYIILVCATSTCVAHYPSCVVRQTEG